MKKILSIALVALLAAGTVFAGFSGNANVALGYNFENKSYGFSNGSDFTFDLALGEGASSEKKGEGDIYAGVNASMVVKVGNDKNSQEITTVTPGKVFADGADKDKAPVYRDKDNKVVSGLNEKKTQIVVPKYDEDGKPVLDSEGKPVFEVKDEYTSYDLYKYKEASPKGTSIWQKDGVDTRIGVFFTLAEAYVGGENWKVSITGSTGSPDLAKSAIDTKTDAVKDIFGNQYDTKDVPVSFKAAGKDAAGITAEYAGYKASIGFEGSANPDYEKKGTRWTEIKGVKDQENTKYDESSINGLFLKSSEKFTGKYWNFNAFVQTPVYDFDVVTLQAAAIASRNENDPIFENAFLQAYGASAKVGFDADIATGFVAADFGIKQTVKEDRTPDAFVSGLDIAANLAISPVALDIYYKNENLSEAKLANNLFSTKLSVDLAAFEIPVAISVAGKDLINDQKISAEVSTTINGLTAKVNGGYIVAGSDATKWNIGGEVSYDFTVAKVSAGIGYSAFEAKGKEVLTLKASAESSTLIPGAILSISYGAADEDQNLLKGKKTPQNFGKLEAKCKIEF